MIITTIKAFRKDKKGYYWRDDFNKKIYYEAKKKYTCEGKIRLFINGFHASLGLNISNTLTKDSVRYSHYGIVEINAVDKSEKVVAGNEMTIKKFLPNDFDILCEYDKTGEWTYEVGLVRPLCLRNFNHKKGLDVLSKIDKTGRWIYLAGLYWERFNFKRGLDILIKNDKIGGWICEAGKFWEDFDFDKGLNAIIKVDRVGNVIYGAGVSWEIFDYQKGFDALAKIKDSGRWIYDAGRDWREFNYEKGLSALEKQGVEFWIDLAKRNWHWVK